MSCVPNEACEHEFKVIIATSDRLVANMKVERELCRERGPGWLHLHAICDVHRASTMQSRSLGHVKELGSRLVHLCLPLRMSGHMKWYRACMRTVVESKLTLLHGACRAKAADYCSYILEVFVARCQFAAKRRSLLWVWCNGDWRNKSAIEHYVDPAGHFAQTRSYISREVVNAFLSALQGNRPCSLAIGGRAATSLATRSACCSPSTMSRTTAIWPSLCRVVSGAPDLSCQRPGHLRQRR